MLYSFSVVSYFMPLRLLQWLGERGLFALTDLKFHLSQRFMTPQANMIGALVFGAVLGVFSLASAWRSPRSVRCDPWTEGCGISWERPRTASIAQDVDRLAKLYAEDAVHEFPFTTPAALTYRKGRAAIAEFANRYRNLLLQYTGAARSLIAALPGTSGTRSTRDRTRDRRWIKVQHVFRVGHFTWTCFAKTITM